ncbi:UNVERIFIED_CONTAM: hypothetical protein Sradi_4480900 [Sesamum radiatum]|uniref:Uncharacterized protein n=1 Tax=Sesamum radiatum TaxID=300843 RepID=A0AAW2NAY5_SESRA
MKQILGSKRKEEVGIDDDEPSYNEDEELKGKESSEIDVCSTPKGKRFKIARMGCCPPAPKKKTRLLTRNCLLRQSCLEFFASAEVDVFFLHVFKKV